VCFEPDSSPPIAVLHGAAVSHDDLVLEAADGNRFATFVATPDEPREATVLILPDVRGLYRFYEELALRFAERGYTALAFDFYGRTAGVEKRGADFDYREHVGPLTTEQIRADVTASVAQLRRRGARKIVTVGFCLGGRHSWLAAADGHGLSAAIGFYGRPGFTRDGVPGPKQRVAEIEAPILGLMGGADQAIAADEVEAFDRALDAAGVEHELVTYEGAPHSFFDRKQEQFADASEDAWRRTLEFVAAHTGP
jgi:carboxymethylenebutenolidase